MKTHRPIITQQQREALGLALRVWLVRLLALVGEYAPLRGYLARVAHHLMRICELEFGAYVGVCAVSTLTPPRPRQRASFRRVRRRISMRQFARLALSRAPKHSLTARIAWLRRALAAPERIIARVARAIRAGRLNRTHWVTLASPTLEIVCAGAALPTRAPDD